MLREVIPSAGSGTRMRARSRIVTRADTGVDGQRRNLVHTLLAEAPLLLKLTRRKEPEPWPQPSEPARVSLTAGAAGPVGGDAYHLDVSVGAGSTLVFGDVSPTVLLPGSDGAASVFTVSIDVGEQATLVWLAEPLIAARACNHRHHIDVALAASARLLMREELILGRHGETCGTVKQSVSVRRGGAALHRQDLAVGPAATGYDGAAVLNDAGAAGSVLVVDPAWESAPPPATVVSPNAAVLPLSGPAALVTGVAEDNLTLRRDLNTGLADLGWPWS